MNPLFCVDICFFMQKTQCHSTRQEHKIFPQNAVNDTIDSRFYIIPRVAKTLIPIEFLATSIHALSNRMLQNDCHGLVTKKVLATFCASHSSHV